jgi:hypothetical protein
MSGTKVDTIALALSAKSRRNPLKKADAKKASLELKRAALVEATKRNDKVYALGWVQDGEINYFYVGCTLTPAIRLQQHARSAKAEWNIAPKYLMWRELESAGHTITLTVLDEEGEFTEKEWCDVLTEQGHLLTNAMECVDTIRKVTSTVTKKVIAEEKEAALPKLIPCIGVKDLLKGKKL